MLQAALVVAALVNLTPLLWLVCAAFKRPEDVFAYWFVPWGRLDHLTVGNFSTLLKTQPVARWMINSTFLAATQTVSVVILSSLGGFALAKYQFRGRRLFMGMIIVVTLLPGQVTLGSLYELVGRLGWLNSYLAI